MNKNELKQFVNLIRSADMEVSKYHPELWFNSKSNYYNSLNFGLHIVLNSIYNLEQVSWLETYMYDRPDDFTFEDLWNKLQEYETNTN